MKKARTEEEGGRGAWAVQLSERLRGVRGSRLPVGWKQGPTQLSIKYTWVPWKGRK